MCNFVRIKFQFRHSNEDNSTHVYATVLPYINELNFPTEMAIINTVRIYMTCFLELAAIWFIAIRYYTL